MAGKKVSLNFMVPTLLSRITISHILVTLLIMSSFILDSLWTHVQYFEKGGTFGTTTTNTAAAQPQAAPTEDLSPKKVSVDDASATPSFYIGKSTGNGVIEGISLIGAYPYTNFKSIIDQQL